MQGRLAVLMLVGVQGAALAQAEPLVRKTGETGAQLERRVEEQKQGQGLEELRREYEELRKRAAIPAQQMPPLEPKNVGAPIWFYNPRPLTAKEIAVIDPVVRSALKEPKSARFRWLDYNGYGYYCGEINARNSDGGSAGPQLFTVKVKLNPSGFIVGAIYPDIITPSGSGDLLYSALSDTCLISTRSGPANGSLKWDIPMKARS
ncbi:hypothetical protein [Microvirga massiliensis]|uniref:hypothetical protein n=1 Tax=Microvirga massiliensis TaxID=1033741 RepID=UPI00065FE2CE|nr:hypothetical protein [Microvirga massiliensis]